MLKAFAIIILPCSLLLGCLQGPYGVDEDFARDADRGKEYRHPTRGQMELEEDKSECISRALDRYPKKRRMGPRRTTRFGMDDGEDLRDDNDVDRRMEYKSCMRSKGWTVVRKRK